MTFAGHEEDGRQPDDLPLFIVAKATEQDWLRNISGQNGAKFSPTEGRAWFYLYFVRTD